MKNYKRMVQNKLIGGVLSGLAYTFGFKTWLVRMVFVLSALTAVTVPFLVLVYILTMVFAPVYDQDPEDYKQICE